MPKTSERTAPTKHASGFIGPRLPEDSWLYGGEVCYDVPCGGRRAAELREHGYWFPVSYQDKELVEKYEWYVYFACSGDMRIRTTQYKTRGGEAAIELPRLLKDDPVGLCVDHFSGNSMDNRRSNLRLASKSQNSMNARKQKGTSSIYKGVSYYQANQKWGAYIRVLGNQKFLGLFPTETEAALAYDAYAREFFGEFAAVNFPNALEQKASRPCVLDYTPAKFLRAIDNLTHEDRLWIGRVYKKGAGRGKTGISEIMNRFSVDKHVAVKWGRKFNALLPELETFAPGPVPYSETPAEGS